MNFANQQATAVVVLSLQAENNLKIHFKVNIAYGDR